ncbi:MAG TPA: hypothetical protein DHV48_20545 [Prolixibacteraceae bacterium]|nr:hypothetical protein [Prolixibacteraceae bacterium]
MLAEPNTHIYEIQAGDTLSEIAAANHTSIEHLMELNPDITNADQIYARHQLIIPDNDHISNPYETGGDFDNQMVNFIDSPISDEPIGEESAGDYDSVDWASFSDDYPGIDDSAYGQALAQTDFDNYHANNSLFESGNDSVSSEFI